MPGLHMRIGKIEKVLFTCCVIVTLLIFQQHTDIDHFQSNDRLGNHIGPPREIDQEPFRKWGDFDFNGTQDCVCINCEPAAPCGDLWKATQISRESIFEDVRKREIHVTLSHCEGDLGFLTGFLDQYNVASIHVITKCGHPVRGLPDHATVEELPNIGRCDHSHVHYITTVMEEKIAKYGKNGRDAIIIFMKDQVGAGNLHQAGRWNSLENMIRVSSSDSGFSCGIVPLRFRRRRISWYTSAYVEMKILNRFKKSSYESLHEYTEDRVKFESVFDDWSDFYRNLGARPLNQDVAQVCFGGVFAANLENIRNVGADVWKKAEHLLSRGNNIQEGHYMERAWAALLASPLKASQVDRIRAYSDFVFEVVTEDSPEGMLGVIAKKA